MAIPRRIPYHFLSVVATFVHLGGASKWLLSSWLGKDGAERFAWATMAAGLLIGVALLFPMARLHFGS